MSSYARNAVGFAAPRKVRRAASAEYRRKVARTRMDVHHMPEGRVHAVLTVTLPGGQAFRFTGEADAEVLYALALRAWRRAGNEVGGFEGRDVPGYNAFRRKFMADWKSGAYDGTPHKSYSGKVFDRVIIDARKRFGVHRTGGFLNDLWGGVESVAKDVAQSGVLKVAGDALSLLGPVLPPPANAAAMTAGAALKGVRALTAAKAHLANGNRDAAAKLVKHAAATVPRALRPVVAEQSERVYALLLKPS